MAKSQEVSGAVLLLVGMVVLVASGGHFAGVLGRNTAYLLAQSHLLGPAGQGGVRELLSANLEVLLAALGPLLAALLIAGLTGNVMQVGLPRQRRGPGLQDGEAEPHHGDAEVLPARPCSSNW